MQSVLYNNHKNKYSTATITEVNPLVIAIQITTQAHNYCWLDYQSSNFLFIEAHIQVEDYYDIVFSPRPTEISSKSVCFNIHDPLNYISYLLICTFVGAKQFSNEGMAC